MSIFKKFKLFTNQHTVTPIFNQPLTERSYTFIDQCCSSIEENLEEVGLYRICGSVANMNKLKELFDTVDMIGLDGYDVHDVAGVMKMFLRELSETLIPFELYDAFIAASTIYDMNPKIVPKLVKLLPELNVRILRRLFLHLNMVHLYSEMNKMTSTNLATVFAPSILQSQDPDPSIIIGDGEFSTRVIKLFIETPLSFFEMVAKTPRLSDPLFDDEPAENMELLIERSKNRSSMMISPRVSMKEQMEMMQEMEKSGIRVHAGTMRGRPLPPVPKKRSSTEAPIYNMPLPELPSPNKISRSGTVNTTKRNRKFTVKPHPIYQDDENGLLLDNLLDSMKTQYNEHRTSVKTQIEDIKNNMEENEYQKWLLTLTASMSAGDFSKSPIKTPTTTHYRQNY